MVDRVTIAIPQIYMPVAGQWQIVCCGSTIDVASASAFDPRQVTNVQPGTGSLLNGQHNNPGANFRVK
jgi:hypothetical protein